MKNYIYIFAIFCATLLSGCSSDEPENNLFRLSFSTDYLEEDNTATYKIGSNYINVDLDGLGQSFIVTLDGNFETFTIAEGAPEWASASSNGNQIIVNVSGFSGPGTRTGKVNFVVFKGSNSETGYIQISQKAITYDDLLAKDRRAVKYFLSQYDVIETIPSDNRYETGTNAPYYKLNSEGTVYMQVISLGSLPPASEGDRIYFRFMRYSLLDYYHNGYLSEGWGNANDVSGNPAFFVVGSTAQSTTQWGAGIPLPIELGLPVDSQINLVVSSDAGLTDEISQVIPYLYNIRYYPGERSAYAVHLYLSNSLWSVFGVSSAQWRYFNKANNIPSGFPYTNSDATGLGGILLIGGFNGDLHAYDAACPVEHNSNVILTINDDLECVCPSCGSKYDIFSLGGVPISGKAAEVGYALSRYNVYFNGNGYSISN